MKAQYPNPQKPDMRPHGSIELAATLYAEYNRAIFIAQHAQMCGHIVEPTMVPLYGPFACSGLRYIGRE